MNIRPKEITPEMGEGANYKMTLQINDFLKRQYARKVNARINWDPYIQGYASLQRENLATGIAGALLQQNNGISKQLLEKIC